LDDVLKRWNRGLLAQILALATISLQSPKKINQEWSKWEVRGLSFASRQFWSKMSKREVNEEVWGVFIPPLTETSRWRRVPGYSEYMFGYSGHLDLDTPDQRVLPTGNSNSEIPGTRPDTPDRVSGHSGLEPEHFGLDSEFDRKFLFKW
jgi:hypothetical protein